MMSHRCVLLDRDGTIVEERHHLNRADGLALIPGAGAALRRLSALGLKLVVVTNQSAVGRGMLGPGELERIHVRLREILAVQGVRLDGIYHCPHLPEDGCACRKPRTGLVEQAARDLDFRPTGSFMIGDQLSDIELGRRIGATTILVRTGYGADLEGSAVEPADYVVDDLTGAANIVEKLLAVERQKTVDE